MKNLLTKTPPTINILTNKISTIKSIKSKVRKVRKVGNPRNVAKRLDDFSL